MKAPDVWIEFGQYIHQDFQLQFPDSMSGFLDFYNSVPKEKQEQFRCYLKYLTTANLRNDELKKIWDLGGPYLYFTRKGEMVQVLSLLYEEISK